MTGPLAGLSVVEIATEISGPYAAKQLADLGAEVTKIEPPEGDPLRRWGPFSAGNADRQCGGLFEYLNAGKRVTTLDDASELIAHADLLVENLGPGTLEGWGFDNDTLGKINPNLLLLRISAFGQSGPWRGRPATSLTLQAASGWVSARDPDRPPVQVGARIAEYVAGAYGALGALTALRLPPAGHVREVDVSELESLLSTLPYPMLMAQKMGSLGLPTNARGAPMLGVVRAADGWVGINCLTGQHWLDVCAMLGLSEFAEQQIAIMMGGPERAEFYARAEPLLAQQTVAQIVDLSQALRIPAAPVNDGATVLECPQYAKREFFVDGGGFQRPGAPFRFTKGPVVRQHPVPPRTSGTLPFAGLKVLDLTTFWAGAYLTCYLGAFGADIVKVESMQRPDGFRYSGAFPFEGDDWYERSGLWQATNLNKKDLTLDLTSVRGLEIAKRLAAQADVVLENFSPRVVEQFGLDYESLAALKPDVIFVRMPGFGLHGPWRDYVGWALNFEQTAGMSAVTGYPDGPPCNPQGPADPVVGVHAGVALLAALEHRRRTGEGQLVEVAQIEVAACVTAEPVIEYSMNGVVQQREGNRRRGYLQGVYPTAEDGVWVALSVPDDSTLDHDVFDELVAGWTRTQQPDAIVETFRAQGIPAEQVITGEQMYDPGLIGGQLDARGYYEEFEHPITGGHRYPGWPFRITPGPDRHHRSAPPTLGQHNDEVLRGLGLSDDELATLRNERVIGERVLGA
ncbi:CaiB/BaiF CoA transferase family protein [Mycobacterium montefiorense]|uniref:CoA transferase n=4 Tax=Mycobacterium montefiorense TaxID=154654 RepID=A0AA37PLT7_9MYCO|nr:CoA transferase [Mycobacterium montefiorense]GBG37531.1 CoA transferase [Mycobacterium montefiorense]GKU41622.1 CoA transferase [Mycobacterium montefiorense]GKU48762.1 CoA transferase [Mycobacterium montefiorense]GKU55678.1 CoA transferase [Mycobacterium montefiorense]GKU62746.1 CoA transferase [Mycobacterium montefiorense]